MNYLKSAILFAASALLISCGGGGADRESTAQVDPASLQSTANYTELLEQYWGAAPDAIDPGVFPVPVIRTLQWPEDFPTELQSGLTETLYIQGLYLQSAYDFDVTLPDSVADDDATLVVMNIDSQAQASGPVCYGDPNCTGTVVSDRVSMQLVSFNTGFASVSIQPSSTSPLIDQGSEANPVRLDLSSGRLAHAGTVGATQASRNQLDAGESFYRLLNLSIGDRYAVSLVDASDDDVELSLDDSVAQCDPAYSGNKRCVLVAGTTALDFAVGGDFVLFGASFVIDVEKVSDHQQFEGSWYAPVLLSAPDVSTLHYASRADRFSSYYHITGLDVSRRYRLFLSGSTAISRLKLNSAQTSLPVYAPQCAALDEVRQYGDQACIVENASSVYFRVEAVDEDSTFLISVEPGAKDIGDVSDPTVLQYQGSLLHHGQVNTSSFYSLRGLTAGTQYLLQINAASSFPAYVLSSVIGEPIECDSEGLGNCVFTAIDTDLSLTISDHASEIGERFLLSVLPVDASDARQPAPYNEQLTLSVGQMPHTGSVDVFYSNYTITGLIADQRYLAAISDFSEPMDFAAWPNTATGIQCNLFSTELAATGCLTQAGSDGKVRIRVGGNSGGQFRISLQDLSVTHSEYQSQDTPLLVADNSSDAAVSTIAVGDSSPVSFIEVVLQIEHGYSSDLLVQLESPDGRMITLADHIPGISFAQTMYTDLADRTSVNSIVASSRAINVYRPANPLHVLTGISRAGNWRLHVVDDTYSNRSDALGGVLLGWGISFIDLQ